MQQHRQQGRGFTALRQLMAVLARVTLQLTPLALGLAGFLFHDRRDDGEDRRMNEPKVTPAQFQRLKPGDVIQVPDNTSEVIFDGGSSIEVEPETLTIAGGDSKS